MRASEIMTRGVVTVPSRASILEAMRLMLGPRISGLPVAEALVHGHWEVA